MPDPETLSFEALIKTNARRAQIVADESLVRISVRARPADGRANKEAIKLIAQSVGVPQKSVELVRGARSKHKIFRICGLDAAPESFAALLRTRK